jgi:hypothetical protein
MKPKRSGKITLEVVEATKFAEAVEVNEAAKRSEAREITTEF